MALTELFTTDSDALDEFVFTDAEAEKDEFDFGGAASALSVGDVSVDAPSRSLDGDDTLIGTKYDDSIEGWGGDDQLFGLAGNDSLYGGYGADALFGGKGADYLHGWRGDNGLFGGGGDDTFFIDSGRNYIETGKGADTVILDFTRGQGAVADFSVETDGILLATGAETPPTVQELIDDGTLKIKGDEYHTVIRFGDAKLDLLGIAREDFNLDLITVA